MLPLNSSFLTERVGWKLDHQLWVQYVGKLNDAYAIYRYRYSEGAAHVDGAPQLGLRSPQPVSILELPIARGLESKENGAQQENTCVCDRACGSFHGMYYRHRGAKPSQLYL